MGSGTANVNFTFQPKAKSPDFNVKVIIDETESRAMNDFLLAYGNFDAIGGLFSFYSELAVRKGEVDGYIKPLFRRIELYDARQDGEKPVFTKIRERFLASLAGILETRPRNEIGAKVTITGAIDDPQFSRWEAVGGILKNAFIQSILPGLENQKPSRS